MERLRGVNFKVKEPYHRGFLLLLSGIILLGCLMRFVGIQENRFVYFDEGMWLNHNRGFVDMVKANPPQNLTEVGKALFFFFRVSIETAKPLWSFISSLRYFFTGAEGWYFVRLVSAISGCLTVMMVFVLVKRLYQSVGLACLSAALLAVLPSHVYYSQLGLQESFSTLFFLAGIYAYMRKVEFNILHILWAGLFLAMVFLSNYRMVVSPVFIFMIEGYLSWSQRRGFDVRKFVWLTLIFLFFGLGVGIFNKGNNVYVSFGWMFHQSSLAKGHFEWFNFLSYPYFIFNLETWIFGLLFFGSMYFLYRKEWLKFFPTLVVFLQMVLFSFSQEKAARFLCVVLPFMAIASALVINEVLIRVQHSHFKKVLYACMVLMLAQQLKADAAIVRFRTDYQSSIEFIRKAAPAAKILSTQSEIQTLYASQAQDVVKVPMDHAKLLEYARSGYRYLILDPQAYISCTDNQKRFTLKLAGYLGFLEKTVKPVQTFPHFHPELLKRFVFDHNESLAQSISFLKRNQDGHSGSLKIYDVNDCVEAIQQAVAHSKKVR